MAKSITSIPVTVPLHVVGPYVPGAKRRVAAYARVSTDKDEQLTSYEQQIDYYTKYINARPDWEMVEMYSDEGITGCNTHKREGFKRMIADALDGKIDLIVTKSVSRFARNTVDSLSTIRKLKEKGVEVFFEKENIWTFDGKGELLISIRSSIAQEESRSISENCTWGQRKRFADGKPMVPFGRFLGYDRGPDGEMVVNHEQAKIIRRIYSLFLGGHTPYGIAKILTNDGVPTPGGKTIWGKSVVESILTNEKYKGDALLQKVFTEDFLTKKKVKNTGQVPQFYVSEDHEAIIDPVTFDLVQEQMTMRRSGHGPYSGVHTFSGTVFCGDCGSAYGQKLWHASDKYRRRVWLCNHKYDKGHKCTTPRLTEQELKAIVVSAMNRLCSEREELAAAHKLIRDTAYDTSTLRREAAAAQAEAAEWAGQVNASIHQNATMALDQDEHAREMQMVGGRYQEAMDRFVALQQKISDLENRRKGLDTFFRELLNLPEQMDEFDPTAYHVLVERITVYSREKVVVRFRDGTEIDG